MGSLDIANDAVGRRDLLLAVTVWRLPQGTLRGRCFRPGLP